MNAAGSAVAVDWLTARPIAHRGLHDRAGGIVENSLSAARAAIDAGYAIECDVQVTGDGEAVVFHDFALDRLTAASGPVAARTAAVLGEQCLRGSTDRIPTLPVFLSAIAGRVPVICEIKSAFDGDPRLSQRVAAVARGYGGPLALKSFDPAVLVALRSETGLERNPLGIVAEATYRDPEWQHLGEDDRRALAALTHLPASRPDFLSYCVDDLPQAAATLFRVALARPVITWTVRTPDQRQRAAEWADGIVFEDFRP